MVLAIVFYFYGEHKENAGVEMGKGMVMHDSTTVRIDTVIKKVPDPFPVYYERKKQAEVDTLENIIFYSAGFDTTVVVDGDTLAVITEDVIFDGNMLEVIREIKIIPVEKLIIKTITEWQTVMMEVPADPPFYNTFWFASIFWGLVAVIVAVASTM